MSILNRLMSFLGLGQKSSHHTYEFSESLQVTLKTLAEQEGRTEGEIIPDLLAAGLTQYNSVDKLWTKWESLSPRERDVTVGTARGAKGDEELPREPCIPNGMIRKIEEICLGAGKNVRGRKNRQQHYTPNDSAALLHSWATTLE